MQQAESRPVVVKRRKRSILKDLSCYLTNTYYSHEDRKEDICTTQ